MSVPVLSKERLTGLMVVWRTGKGLEFENDELEFLNSLAQQAAVAIENARLFAETQRLAEELEQRVVERTAEVEREKANTETLLRILTEVSASLDLDRALSRTLALLNEAVGGEQGTIMLLHAEDNLLHYRAGYGYLTGSRYGLEKVWPVGWSKRAKQHWSKIYTKTNVGSRQVRLQVSTAVRSSLHCWWVKT